MLSQEQKQKLFLELGNKLTRAVDLYDKLNEIPNETDLPLMLRDVQQVILKLEKNKKA